MPPDTPSTMFLFSKTDVMSCLYFNRPVVEPSCVGETQISTFVENLPSKTLIIQYRVFLRYNMSVLGNLKALTNCQLSLAMFFSKKDIRELGFILGNILKEQEGKDLFETEEKLRALTKSLRTDYDQRTRKVARRDHAYKT